MLRLRFGEINVRSCFVKSLSSTNTHEYEPSNTGTKSRNQPENHTLRKILTTVTRVINRVVHSVHTAPYIPPAAEKGSVYAPFELVGPEEFSLLIAACTSILGENDRALVRVEAPSKIFGDIHGQIFDLVQFFRQYGSPSHHVGDMNLCNYVFAGDFVDRGAYSLEVLTVLMCLKIRYHPHVVLLRGNHEDQWANERYGLHKEIGVRLGNKMSDDDIKDLKHHILALFQRLPLAALIGKRILCVHGGPGLHVKTLKEIEDIRLPFAYDVRGVRAREFFIISHFRVSITSEEYHSHRSLIPQERITRKNQRSNTNSIMTRT